MLRRLYGERAAYVLCSFMTQQNRGSPAHFMVQGGSTAAGQRQDFW